MTYETKIFPFDNFIYEAKPINYYLEDLSNTQEILYDQTINSTYNITSKPVSSPYKYLSNTANNEFQSPLKNVSKTITYYTSSPQELNYEAYSNKLLSTNTNNYPTIITNTQNNITNLSENEYKARSPVAIRKNNFLINNDESKSGSSFYSKSPAHSIDKQENNNINSNVCPIKYITYKYDNTTPKNNNNIFSTSKQNIFSTNQNTILNNVSKSPNPYSKNLNKDFDIDSGLIYPTSSNHINYNINNISRFNYANKTSNKIPSNIKNNVISNYPSSNNMPNNINNITNYTPSPSSPSTLYFMNNISSNTYQTIQNENSDLKGINNKFLNIPSTPSKRNENKKVEDFYKQNTTTPSKKSKTKFPFYDIENYNIINNNMNPFQNSGEKNQISPFKTKTNDLKLNSSPENIIFNKLNPKPLYSKELQYSEGVKNNDPDSNIYDGITSYNSPNKISPFYEKKAYSPKISEFNKNKDIGNLSPTFSNQKDNISFSLNDERNNFKNNLDSNPKENENYKLSSDNLNANKNNDYNNKFLINQNLSENIPSDLFSQCMFEYINQIRNNPKNFIQRIKNSMENIGYDKRGNIIYKGKLKVALYKGKIAFEEAISFLEKTSPMQSLIFKKELCVDIPNNENDFSSGDYLREKITEKIKNGISIRGFWRDIIKDPYINFLLMIVDDNPIRRGDKRKDILNPKMRYIGIKSGYLGKNFVCYTVLSNE